jgi:hypothetical protein
MKNLTKKAFEENRSKLSFVKEFIEGNNYKKAISIVATFPRLAKSLSIVKDTHEVINNPTWASLYLRGKTAEQAIEESVQAIKAEYKF